MSCATCAEALEVDGLQPECIADPGCPIPGLDEDGQRIMEARSLILKLKKLIDPGTVCRILHIDRTDLELLALVEEELTEHGERHQGPDCG